MLKKVLFVQKVKEVKGVEEGIVSSQHKKIISSYSKLRN